MLLRIYDRYIILPSTPQLQYPRNSKTCGRAHSTRGFTDVTNNYSYTHVYCFFFFLYRHECGIFTSYVQTTSFTNLYTMDSLQTLKKLHRPARQVTSCPSDYSRTHTHHTCRSPNTPPYKQRYAPPKYGRLFHVLAVFQTANINK
jgi:hypothetical protein